MARKICAALVLLCYIQQAAATQLYLQVDDPVGDNTGAVDVISMVMVFDNLTGDYEISIESTTAAPFLGEFRININLFNPDTGNPDGSSLFRSAVRAV